MIVRLGVARGPERKRGGLTRLEAARGSVGEMLGGLGWIWEVIARPFKGSQGNGKPPLWEFAPSGWVASLNFALRRR